MISELVGRHQKELEKTLLTQRAQFPLVQEYSLTHNISPYGIQAIFRYNLSHIP